MNSHFCKVGKTSPNNNKIFSLKDLEDKYIRFVEEAYNVEQTDMSLSDILRYEAKKLKQIILSLKRTNSKDLDAAF
ncbi:Lacal_2735 family protein [Psychroserpens algicola]|uniref:Lacal_2735 family protein n=1 Tax=Psychroserpens algicola TaxID=1719034 RepID=UPI001952B63A|nr:Lacal_2735 family protein [Psychroserpens algicola]